MRLLTTLTTDLLDLVLARACLACGQPGRAWCAACLAACPRDRAPNRPVGGDVALVSATRYDGVVREAIVDYKEHGNRALAPMLGQLLAEAVLAYLRNGDDGAVLVPVPGHRRPERGFDALGGIVRPARARLAELGIRTALVTAVRLDSDPGPIKYLDRRQRQAAVAGTMRPARSRWLARATRSGLPLIVVDDVVTTGGTVTEAVAALKAVGIEPAGVAAVARATR